MQVTYQLTAEDAYQGLLAWRGMRAWKVWLRWFACINVGFVAIISVFALFVPTHAFPAPFALKALGFAVVWFGLMVGYPRYCVYRQVKGSPAARSPITLNISDESLEVHTAHADSRSAWSGYVAWGERKSVFIILPQPRMYVTIPKRAFTDEPITTFRDLLRSKIVPKK